MNNGKLKGLMLALVMSLAAEGAYAQDEIDKLLAGSASDATKLAGAYVAPFMKSFSTGINSGWYNTAKPHKIVGIDLTATFSVMSIPGNETSYDVSKLGLQNISLASNSPGAPNAPTVFGSKSTPIFKNNGTNYTFNGPAGTGQKFVPVPMVQLGIGLPKNTDVKLRFAPSLNFDNNKGEFKMFGVGIMHDVKQYIPGIKNLPFDLSAFIGYSKLSLTYAFDNTTVYEKNKQGTLNMSATTIQGVISKKIAVLTLYGGLGYSIAKSDLALKGTYDAKAGTPIPLLLTDPVSLDYSASTPRITAGFRLKLAVLTIHADYTLQKYNALTVGLGLSVR